MSLRWYKLSEFHPEYNEVVEICTNPRLLDSTLIESDEIIKAIYKDDKFMAYGKERKPIFWRRICKSK